MSVNSLKSLQAEIGRMETAYWNRNANKLGLMAQKKTRNYNLQKKTNNLSREQEALQKKKQECDMMITELTAAVQKLTNNQAEIKKQRNTVNNEIKKMENELISMKNVLKKETDKAKNMRTIIEKNLKNGPPSGNGPPSNREVNKKRTGFMGAIQNPFTRRKSPPSVSSTASSSVGRTINNFGNFYNKQQNESLAAASQ